MRHDLSFHLHLIIIRRIKVIGIFSGTISLMFIMPECMVAVLELTVIIALTVGYVF